MGYDFTVITAKTSSSLLIEKWNLFGSQSKECRAFGVTCVFHVGARRTFAYISFHFVHSAKSTFIDDLLE